MNAQGQPLVPRPVVVLVTLVVLGAMVYTAAESDYRSLIVLAVVLLFILGADLGAMLRIWRGGGEPTAPVPPRSEDGTPT